MNPFAFAALTLLAASSLALFPGALAQRVDVPANQPVGQFDPARLYGSVEVPNTNSGVNANFTLPSGLLGSFNTATLLPQPRVKDGLEAGVEVTPQLKIVSLRGPVGIGVELKGARLLAKPRGDAGEASALQAQMRFFVNSSEFTTGKKLPLEITLENTGNGNRLSFFVTVSVR
jgi:hypothetical protein